MCKVVVVDATFLTSQYKGALIVATAQDGDHHQYPLAWGVIDREKDASWLWFMTRLSEVIPDGPDVVVLSDRHKSIIKVAREVYKQAQHDFCVRHIAHNLKVHVNRGSRRKSSNGETVSKLFFKCAAAYTIDEFEYLYDDLKSRYPKVAEYMQKEELAPENWARCKFKSEMYNMLTTNGAESINSVLKKAKKYPLLSLLYICLGKTVEWFNRHMLEVGSSDESQKLTPFVYKELHERYEKACTFDVQELNGVTGEFEVRDDKGRRHLVNLGERTCGCKMFDVDRYPCSHAIAVAHMIGKGDMIYELCSEYYRRDTWHMAYQETVYPFPDCCDWKLPSSIADVVVLPPIVEEKRN
ncbi:PREDICTED: protein FAR1-RELATED SEQUENCE 4-like [Tarenaya hassleriana]|uniref:protein FAR1-RELATED SEQUENCE 4-like n=1 Tax=Tarenaya hassleriana TaxID=28532 RepID=UPI00053C9AAB|nr:PREDICTED: protein FAR1-RELATED SEQUENCE 4-like [Tarenaya hassleriana]